MAYDVNQIFVLSQYDGHIYADCFAWPIDYYGKVNSKDTSMHAQQSLNLLRIKNLRIILVSCFHHAYDYRKRIESIRKQQSAFRYSQDIFNSRQQCFFAMY